MNDWKIVYKILNPREGETAGEVKIVETQADDIGDAYSWFWNAFETSDHVQVISCTMNEKSHHDEEDNY